MEKEIKVLVVEDNEGSILMIKEVFKRVNRPVNILVNRSVKHAIKSLEDNANSIDLVLLDIGFPKEDGWYLLEECLQKNYSENFSVVILTTSININDRLRATEFDNIIGFCSKPISTVKITEILDTYDHIESKKVS